MFTKLKDCIVRFLEWIAALFSTASVQQSKGEPVMSALSIQPTYPIFTETDGQPLEDGYIWIGQTNLDPQVNPINVYWDAALTLPANQPIRTLGGYPSNNGTPARLYVNSDYSIRVMNKNGSLVYSAPSATERYSDVVLTITSEDIDFIQAGPGAVVRTSQNKMRDVVSVMDFIPPGTDTANTDCTPYFNLATRASETFTGFADAFYREIFIPGGQYRIDGLVYVRKGQHLRGAGMGAAYLDLRNNVGGVNLNTGGIVLGKGSSGVADPTGLPPEVSGIFTLGGSTAIECTPAGAAIHSCFISFPITGINYSGSDLVVTNCIFDNGTNCMFVSGQNATFSNCIFYLANQQVYVIGGANDIVFDNCVFEYPQVASIYLRGGNNKNINISGSTFLMNQQYAGHQAFIFSAASTDDSVYVSGCSFRNGKGPIYKHTSGSTYASFKACVIDGEKTINSYTQSTTAYGIDAGGVAEVDVDGCTFKNLYDTVIKHNSAGAVRVKNCDINSAAGAIAMSAAGGQLVVNDVAITGTGATPITFTGTSSQSMKLDGVRFTSTGGTYDITIAGASALASVELYNIIGSGRQLFSYTGTTLFFADNLKNWLDPVVVSTSRYVKIPYVGAQTINFSITGNPDATGNLIYRKSDYGVMCVDFDYTGLNVAQTYLWKNDLLKSTATGNSMPTITAELQALGSGAVSAGHVISGLIILSWPTTFTLETIMATPINGVRPV